jgi:hypothetical protein
MPVALLALVLLQVDLEIELSPGPFERTWALLDPRVEARLPADLPLGQTASEELWSAWAERVDACRAGEPAQRAQARLWLAALAATQGRGDDAWEHLAHAGEAPAGLRAVLPLLAPGVAPADLAAWPALPAGARLAPLSPPPGVPAAEVLLGVGRVRDGHAAVRGFTVGGARVEFALRVEGDGVQIELAHAGGPATELELAVPAAPDFTLASVHVDWERVEAPQGRLRVALAPGGEPVAVYGRYRPRRIEWPTSTPAELNAQIGRDGLCLWSAPGADLGGLRAGLATLLDVAVLATGDPVPPARGLVLDLRDAATRDEKLAGLVSLAERFALSR